MNAFRYESERKIRVAVIHGMARMAALMASTYKAYLGVGLGPLEVGTSILQIYQKMEHIGNFNLQYNMPCAYSSFLLFLYSF